MVKRILFLFFIILVCPDAALAELRVAGIFSDNMVLQRNEPIWVWGTAAPKEVLTVCLDTESVRCKADAKGHWKVGLSAREAGGPYILTIQSNPDTMIFRDLLIGDVWFASGQSNMEHPMEGWKWVPDSEVYSSKEEIADSDYPEIRLFTVPKYPSSQEVEDVPEGKWEVAGPRSVRGFSSTAWFFGKALYSDLKVPVGIINCSWAGTSIKTWVSKEVMTQFSDSLHVSDLPVIPSRSEVMRAVTENQARRYLISYPAPWQIDELDRLADTSWFPLLIPDINQPLQEVVWIKKEVEIPEAPAKEVQELSLGFLNGQSIVYFNGTKVGSYSYPEPVVALIPRRLVRPGKNRLTVRLSRPFGSPVAEGESGLFYLSARDRSHRCELAGEWLATTSLDTIPLSQEEYRNFPCALFNGMVSPCLKLRIKGVIWFQGEDDLARPHLYKRMFHALVSDWRKKWEIKELPFLYVQLTEGVTSPQGKKDIRRRVFWNYQQLSLPLTGMVVSYDVGDPYDVHPRNKKEIGERLARKALEIAY